VWDGDIDFKALLKQDQDIVRVLGVDAIDGIFDLSHHLAYVDTIFERVFHGKDR